MKFVLIIWVLFSCIPGRIFPSVPADSFEGRKYELSSDDSINIMKMVEEQILMARYKQTVPYEPSSLFSEMQNGKVNDGGFFQPFSSLRDDIKRKIVILLSASAIVFSIVFIRRKMINKDAPVSSKDLEESIRKFSEEFHPVRRKEKPQLRMNPPENLSNNFTMTDEHFLNSKAKELKIGKGELLLAARLNGSRLNKYYLKVAQERSLI